jgi:hypothetical protein
MSMKLRSPDFTQERLTHDGNYMQLDPPRTLDQNAAMWGHLRDIASQVQWPVNGKMDYLSAEDWKDIFSAELKKEQRIAQGLSGGFVLLGLRTSRLKKRELSDLIEIINAFGAEHNVKWSEPDDL